MKRNALLYAHVRAESSGMHKAFDKLASELGAEFTNKVKETLGHTMTVTAVELSLNSALPVGARVAIFINDLPVRQIEFSQKANLEIDPLQIGPNDTYYATILTHPIHRPSHLSLTLRGQLQ